MSICIGIGIYVKVELDVYDYSWCAKVAPNFAKGSSHVVLGEWR